MSKKYQKCIDRIKASVKEGKITDAKAQELLAWMDAQQKLRAAKGDLNREMALKEIAGEILNTEAMKVEVAKRNAMLNLRARRQAIQQIVKEKNLGTGMQRNFERVTTAIQAQEIKFRNKFVKNLEAAGVWDYFRKADEDAMLTIAKEVEQLTLDADGKPGFTGEKNAAAVAKVWREAAVELAAIENRHGATIEQARNWLFPQIVDANKLRKLGVGGWGKANADISFKEFKKIMATLEVDWERTLRGGTDKEKFLLHYFRNLYSGVHLRETDMGIDPSHSGGGSLAAKESARRLLWFKDAESAFKFNQHFGKYSLLEAFFARLQNGARAAVLMENFGPDVGGTLQKTREYALVRAREKADADAQVRSINKSKSSEDVLMGKTSVSVRPGYSNFVDGLRAVTLLSKGANMFMSLIGDKATMETAMSYRGISAANRFIAHAQGVAFRSADSKAALRDQSVYLDSLLGATASAHTGDMTGARFLNRRVAEVFNLTQFTRINETHRHGIAAAYAAQLADDAGLSFDALPRERLQDLEDFSINKTEWDIWRSKVQDVEMSFGTYKMLLADVSDNLSDAELNKIVASHGLSPTSANRQRARDEMDMKVRALFQDVVSDAMTENTLRYRAATSVNKMRGESLREMSELFFMFKGYPINAVIRMIERERRMTGASSLGEYVSKHGIPGGVRMAWHIGKTTMAGILLYELSELRKGRTPAPLMTPEGRINWDLWFNGAVRGGGLGIYGDLLLNEYDDRSRSFSQTALGPVLGELDPLLSLKSRAGGALMGEDGESGNRFWYGATKFAQQNTPYINLFFVKPAMDYLIFNQMYEVFSPGVARRRARGVENRGQEYLGPLYDPRDAVASDPLGTQKLVNDALDLFEN